MQKSAIATLTVLILMTMTLSSTLVGMPVEEEPVRSLTEDDGVCTSDGDCPDGYICSSTGECVKPQTCDANGDCPDGQICQDGVCIDNPDQEDGNGCESNEDCTDGQYCDENGECADDPTQDDSCTSDADCADGQICGAAGECMDAPDDSGNETDGNETNDGGDEPQYRNCSHQGYVMGSKKGIMVCDDETGEWVELEDTRPTSVEIGCDEEPAEEQLDASNFADLLNEHDEILIRDGDDTIWMRKTGGSDHYFKPGVERQEAMNGSNGSCSFPACRAWDAVDFEITPQSRVFLVDIENNHSRTEMVVIEEENATHVSTVFSSFAQDAFGTEGRSNSSDFDEQREIVTLSRLSVSLNGSTVDIGLSIMYGGMYSGIFVGKGGVEIVTESYTFFGEDRGVSGRSNSSDYDYNDQVVRWFSSISLNGSDVFIGSGLSAAPTVGIMIYSNYYATGVRSGYDVELSAANGSAPWYGLEVWQTKGEIGDVNGDGFDDIVLSNQNQTLVLRSVLARVLDGQSQDNPNMFVSGKSIQIGMDGNGAVANANIVRSITTDGGCLMAEDLESTNKDDDGVLDGAEDESSNVLVAAGGVEVTTRDAAVAGVAAVTTVLLSAVIRRGGGALRAGDHNSSRSNFS